MKYSAVCAVIAIVLVAVSADPLGAATNEVKLMEAALKNGDPVDSTVTTGMGDRSVQNIDKLRRLNELIAKAQVTALAATTPAIPADNGASNVLAAAENIGRVQQEVKDARSDLDMAVEELNKGDLTDAVLDVKAAEQNIQKEIEIIEDLLAQPKNSPSTKAKLLQLLEDLRQLKSNNLADAKVKITSAKGQNDEDEEKKRRGDNESRHQQGVDIEVNNNNNVHVSRTRNGKTRITTSQGRNTRDNTNDNNSYRRRNDNPATTTTTTTNNAAAAQASSNTGTSPAPVAVKTTTAPSIANIDDFERKMKAIEDKVAIAEDQLRTASTEKDLDAIEQVFDQNMAELKALLDSLKLVETSIKTLTSNNNDDNKILLQRILQDEKEVTSDVQEIKTELKIASTSRKQVRQGVSPTATQTKNADDTLAKEMQKVQKELTQMKKNFF